MTLGIKCDRCDGIANYTDGVFGLCWSCKEAAVRKRSLAAQTGHDWSRLRASLAWQYGPERAASIIAGTDDATNADLAKWRTLGEPK